MTRGRSSASLARSTSKAATARSAAPLDASPAIAGPPSLAAAEPAAPTPPARALRRSQAQRRELSEQKLLDAALNLVAQRGTARMTLAEIGEAAGYSRGLPAARFGSKAALMTALAGHIGQRFGEKRAADRSLQPGLDAILGNIHFYFSRRSSELNATRALLVMITEAGMDHPDAQALRQVVAGYNRQALAWFEHHIRLGQASGEIRPDVAPDTSAMLLLGAMRGVLQQWLVMGSRRVRLPAVRDQLLAVARQMLASSG